MTHPAFPGQPVPVFRDVPTACAHLRDHLLTAPECFAWLLVMPGYSTLLDPADGDGRWQYLQRAEATHGASAQPLYDLYCDAILLDARDAAALGWVASSGDATAAIGTSGVLLVLQRELKTAFLPGQGDPAATREARQAGGGRRGLVRERPMRSGRPGRPRDDRQTRRETRWAPAERLYYRVFRPAMQFVRRAQHCCRDMHGRLIPGDYALLKDVLPSGRRLKYTDWLALRQECRGKA